MSFFSKIFTNQKKAEQPVTQEPQPEMTRIDAVCAALEKRIQAFVERENKY